MRTAAYHADLHNHTTASDGSFTPEELVKYSVDMGIRVLGITDHDTIDGLPAGLAAARLHQTEVLPGVEITVRFVEPFFTGSLHLLAYFDAGLLDDSRFSEETRSVLSLGRGEALTQTRIDAINSWFAPGGSQPLLPRPLLEADVYAHGDRISRRHFALALDAMGIKDRQTINHIIGNESPAYIPSGSPMDALDGYLKEWPLAVILAHPAAGSFPGENLYREVLPPYETVDALMPVFLNAGLAGFEIEYPGHTEEWKASLRESARRYGLPLVSGGSDCHDRISRPLGVAGVGEAEVAAIRDFIRNRS